MTVFASQSSAQIFKVREGDVGYVPKSMSHYVQNTGDAPLRYLELFRAIKDVDVSLSQWLALTQAAGSGASQDQQAHQINERTVDAFAKVKARVVRGS